MISAILHTSGILAYILYLLYLFRFNDLTKNPGQVYESLSFVYVIMFIILQYRLVWLRSDQIKSVMELSFNFNMQRAPYTKMNVFCGKCGLIVVLLFGLRWIFSDVTGEIYTIKTFADEMLLTSLDAVFYTHPQNLTFAGSNIGEKMIYCSYTISLYHGVALMETTHGIIIVATFAIWEIVSLTGERVASLTNTKVSNF